MKRRSLPAVAVGSLLFLLLAAWAAPAAAQGVVFDAGSVPVPINRVRALLVFQEFGGFANPEARGRDNRCDLLAEIELADPAPEGSVWLLSAPGAASAGPGDPAVLDEMSAYWRKAPRQGAVPIGWQEKPLAPAPPPWNSSEAAASPSVIAGPMKLAALSELLKDRKMELPGAARASAARQDAEGWRFFLAEVPAGATRLSAHLTFKSEVAFYPGALGAEGTMGPIGQTGPMRLPPIELMILHPHFVNVDDNSAGLGPCLGLGRAYQDPGTLQDGGQLWADPARGRPGPARESAGELGTVAKFMTAAAPEGKLFLTVMSGAPSAEEADGLDFEVFSHYPSAVDPLPIGRSLLWFAGVSVAIILLAGWLLKKRGFAQ